MYRQRCKNKKVCAKRKRRDYFHELFYRGRKINLRAFLSSVEEQDENHPWLDGFNTPIRHPLDDRPPDDGGSGEGRRRFDPNYQPPDPFDSPFKPSPHQFVQTGPSDYIESPLERQYDDTPISGEVGEFWSGFENNAQAGFGSPVTPEGPPSGAPRYDPTKGPLSADLASNGGLPDFL